MGREAKCTARLDGEESSGKALLETKELLFRGDFRVKVALDSIRSLAVKGEALVVVSDAGRLELDLGAKEAAKWVEAIRHPKSVLDKLGVKAGQKIAVLGVEDEAFLADLEGRVGKPLGRGAKGCDAVFFAIEEASEMAGFAKAKAMIAPDGAVWSVRRKGQGGEVTEAGVRAAGLAAGLVDVKVVAFSETHTAEKFVVPLAERS